MVKIIDAKEDLSIQVHPDNEYAGKHECGALGKTECWYILDCRDDAALILGHNAADKPELKTMIQEGKWFEFVREVPVRKGSFVQIDPGCVHAIKGGLLIYETEQNSDVTYRVYDYGRLSGGAPRELHLQQSIDVITVPAKPVENSVIETSGMQKNHWNELITCESYRVWKLVLEKELEFNQKYPFLMMSVLEGSGSINGTIVKKGIHMILPYGFGKVRLKGNMEIIASTVGSG